MRGFNDQITRKVSIPWIGEVGLTSMDVYVTIPESIATIDDEGKREQAISGVMQYVWKFFLEGYSFASANTFGGDDEMYEAYANFLGMFYLRDYESGLRAGLSGKDLIEASSKTAGYADMAFNMYMLEPVGALLDAAKEAE